jgi:phosphate/sulfate permease
MKIDWMTTITTIIGAILGQGVAANVDFLNDLIPIAQTSVGEIVSMIVGGGIGGAVGGALQNRNP